MARRRKPTALLLTVKWIVVPLALAALGYYVVGPQLGSTGAELLQKLAERRTSETTEAPTNETSNGAKYQTGPEVEVEVGGTRP